MRSELGFPDLALEDLSAAIKADPSNWRVISDRADFWATTGHPEQALKDNSAAIALNPLCSRLFCNRGMAEANLKAYGDAIKDFEQSIRLDSNYAESFNDLAWILATCKEARYRDGKRAVELATRACDLTHSRDAPSLDTLAAAYAETGDFDSAILWEQKAIKVQPLLDTFTRYHAALARFKDHKPLRE